jgi:hypothetical protein
MRSSEQRQTVSRVHQNTAAWHYARAMEAWDEYNHCLADGATFPDGTKIPDGLYHPDFVNVVKKSLSDFRRHCSIADRLMRIRQ